MIRNEYRFKTYRLVHKKAMPDFQAWLKLMNLFLLITLSRWRRGWWWSRILVVTLRGDHIVLVRNLCSIRIGAGEQEHIQNNGHQGQIDFFHFYVIFNVKQRGGCPDSSGVLVLFSHP